MFMDPHSLIAPAGDPAVTAPMWFIVFFKVLGFTLHAIPMSLWYAGILVALGLRVFGNPQGRHYSGRFMRQMPVIVAVGINLGIVPLLFTQLAYSKLFYPATILMAWSWLAIIVMLIPAYYGVYLYAWGLKKEEKGLSAGRQLAGWLAAVLFILIGFIFANGLTLMAHVDRWPELWLGHQKAGAALGTAMDHGNPALIPRWLLMFGLALSTTAVWVLVDMVFFFSKASEEYQRWAWGFAKKAFTIGLVWTVAAGSWYVFGTWPESLRRQMFSGGLIFLTMLTGLSIGLPWLMILMERRYPAKRLLVAGIAAAQVGVMALNANSRQVVQNLEVEQFFDVLGQKTELQLGPMMMFLIVFVLGLGVLAWMVRHAIRAARYSHST